MTEEGTELEKVPLSKSTTKSEHDSHQSGVPEIVVLDEDSRPSTSGKSVPAINWGDKKVSPDDLEVSVPGACTIISHLAAMMSSSRWCCHHACNPGAHSDFRAVRPSLS